MVLIRFKFVIIKRKSKKLISSVILKIYLFFFYILKNKYKPNDLA